MFPGTLAAAVVVIGLVPGHVFLSRIRGYREATGSDSPLESLIGLMTAGLATSGTAVVMWSLICPAQAAWILNSIGHAEWDAKLVRGTGAAVVVILATALFLSYCTSEVVRHFVPKRYHPRALKEVLAERKNEYTWLRVEMKDGSRLIGALHGSDYTVNQGSRDIVLRAPIMRSAGKGDPDTTLEVSRVVVSEDAVSLMQVTYLPRADSKEAKTRRVMKEVRRRLAAIPTDPRQWFRRSARRI